MTCAGNAIIRGTTPTVEVVVDADLTGLELHLCFDAGARVVKETADMTVNVEDGKTTITAVLTQADTLSFAEGSNCEVQLRGFNADGSVAMASSIGTVPVLRIIEDGYLPPDWSE